MLKVEYTTQFKRDLKLIKRMNKIENEDALEKKICDRRLKNNWSLQRELHVELDWFLTYRIIQNKKTVIFVITGAHSELFN